MEETHSYRSAVPRRCFRWSHRDNDLQGADNYSYGQLAGPKRAKEVVETWKTRGYESFYTIGTLMKQSAIKTFGSDEEEY